MSFRLSRLSGSVAAAVAILAISCSHNVASRNARRMAIICDPSFDPAKTPVSAGRSLLEYCYHKSGCGPGSNVTHTDPNNPWYTTKLGWVCQQIVGGNCSKLSGANVATETDSNRIRTIIDMACTP